ncbi:putative Subtilisin-like protease 2 [Glarea lozoyensis 74030]|uniref:Putative Subtilisin-like protease 2 n=1 Tax=Glarea lozoyensis (strain ATCC 74030 / MF5533) TaxID=1104152 RepID=H0EW81_GLAL7|nr:putative Subtilisin-like protease 2 [Glarea lozoyensis 74030]
MRALSLLLCFFSILGCLLAANVTSVSQPAAGKAYYKVFPKDDIDITKTSDFIKGVVGAEDLLPWTDVKDKLMHWTVEASMEEVEVLKGDEGVARVEVFVPPTAPVSARSAEDSSPEDDEAAKSYLITPTDGRFPRAVEETRQSLENLVGKDKVHQYGGQSGSAIWWYCNLTISQKNDAVKISGVKNIYEETGDEAQQLPGSHRTRDIALSLKRDESLEIYLVFPGKKGSTEEETVEAVKFLQELVGEENVSRPLLSGNAVVFWQCNLTPTQGDEASKHPGIRAVERSPKMEKFLRIPAPKAIPNLHPWIDTDQLSHSTCTAGKAVGKNFGASKNAKLVVVQLGSEVFSDFFEALGLIIEDIKSKPERKKKSVVSVSFGFRHVLADHGQQAVDALQERLQKLFDVDVPLFAASGNDAIKRNKIDIDSHPALLATPEFPLITEWGDRSRQPGIWFTTSCTTPARTSTNCSASPSARSTTNNRTSTAASLLKNVQSDFCPEVVKQGGNDPGSGSIGRVYNPDTIEQVSIYLDLPPGTPVPTKEECEAHFMDLIDNCDGNDANNPMNYKAGGLVTVGTNKYHITPEKPRQPASAGVKGDCDSTYKVYFNDYVVWGHGWDSADNGETLKQQVKGCALLPDTWSFAYGLGDDGREWTAKFRTGVFQKKCVGHAGKTASGMEDFGCSGSG